MTILCIPLFCNPVARPPDLHKLLDIHTLNIKRFCQNLIRSFNFSRSQCHQHLFLGRRLDRSIGSFLGGSPCQVALVLLALDIKLLDMSLSSKLIAITCLGVSKIGGLVVVQRQAEFTLISAQVVPVLFQINFTKINIIFYQLFYIF